jgi:hypothetical protein
MFRIQRYIMCALGLLCSVASSQEDALTSANRKYQKSADKVLSEYWSVVMGSRQKYADDLEAVRQAGKQAGDLDLVLKADDALKLFDEDRNVISHEDKNYPTRVRKAAYDYGLTMNDASKKQEVTLSNIKGQYIQYLNTLKRTYTQQGRIEDAIKVKAVITQLTNPVPTEPEPQPQDDRAASHPTLGKRWPYERTGLVYMWENPHPRKSWIDPRITPAEPFTLEAIEGNDFSKYAMQCDGGRTLVIGANDYLLKACQQTNELSIEARVRPADEEQEGPARIITFSQDSKIRNFSLCQEGDQYLLRLRTTGTGLNGSEPDVPLGPLQGDRWTHIVVTYRSGELACYIDGKPQEVDQIGGDFSNWSSQQLLFGNEHQDDRPWHGLLSHIAIYARFMDEEEVQHRYKTSEWTWSIRDKLRERSRNRDE